MLPDTEAEIAATHQRLTDARARSTQLKREPAILAQPTDRLATARDTWRAERDTDRFQRGAAASRPPAPAADDLQDAPPRG